MEGRGRRQRPLKGSGAGTPRIRGRVLLACEGMRETDKEHEKAREGYVGADRGNKIPPGERLRIIGDASWHAGET